MTRISQIPRELLDEMTPAVRAFVEALLAENAALRSRVEELERRLGMNSGNSSLPPSSNGPGQQPVATPKPKSNRKRGGQFGHPKRTRPLIPTERCDRVEHHRPTACRNCGTRLRGHDPSPSRHQVTELPVVKPTITEHQIHTLQCPDCGHHCRGQLPATVPRGCFGPRVVATVTLLSSLGRLSQRMIASLLRDLFSLEVATGQISRLQSAGRKALQAGHDDIEADVRNSAVLNIDETGWRQDGKKAWLWTLVGRLGTLFSVRPSRSRDELHALLGADFNGIVVCDRYSAYNHLEDHRRQFCWAHLLRDFQAMIDRGGTAADAGTRLKDAGQELIHHWNRLRSRQIQRTTFDGHYRRLRSAILDALLDGTQSDEAKTAETCRRLSNECYSLFVFVHHPGVSPTNNAAEQALRKSVIFRKLSFGTEEKTGSPNLAVILSVAETCRRLGKRPLDYVATAVAAAFSNKPAPKLLPAT
ncbi:IS66 family transposase [Schlesneria sp. T3-172]|uniref:IS66 family transposase n=1 Tax=Schlesneria sphaerica TaxID=3373610 RepID=UPI0037CC7727